MPIRCLLVDDEPPALDIIESYVAMVDGLDVVGKCHNAIQAFSVLQSTPVDLMLLDIKMPKLLGTDFVRSLRQPPRVIFTTAYRDYALDGYELDVVDYLLKPISFERFLRAVSKVMRVDQPLVNSGQFQPTNILATQLTDKQTSTSSENTFLYFRVDRKMVKVFIRDIRYIESLRDYVKIITVSAQPLVVKQSISSLEEMLPDADFLRIHRSFIVAIDKITAYTPSHIDIGGQELPIGRLYHKEVGRVLKIGME
ncbi:LytR/AlgR family response regulator transcription factor [Spirosoma endophyticum]|uniref:Two component transcriptional regulator, LytTR family n=1 Tax=Spirosoma endophyticum TaxID=662367 RepID=A0A1I1YFA5_9BACT|nr:LytTR family DNA-binding domain-containing protein [Spirosoma endophyticum]SFE18256.1 two component transcriptional regulator, LytTR family [Spirosoma endophyticum]